MKIILTPFILLFLFISVFAQDGEQKRELLNRFLSNYKTEHRTAYQAAKEFLEKFPADDDENARYMKKWVQAFEKVQASEAAKTPDANAGNSSGSRLTSERHNQLGDGRAKLGEWAEAEAEYRNAVNIEPINAQYRANLATALEKQKKYAEAETEFREAVRLAPDTAQYRVNLGMILELQNKLPEAETEFRKAVALDPENEKLINDVTPFFEKQKKLDFIITLLTPSFNKYKEQARKERAQQNQKVRGLQQRPSEAKVAEFATRLGELYLKAEKYEQAKEHFLLAVVATYNNEPIKAKLELLSSKLESKDNVTAIFTSATWLCDEYDNGLGNSIELTFAGNGKVEKIYTWSLTPEKKYKDSYKWNLNNFALTFTPDKKDSRKLEGLIVGNNIVLTDVWGNDYKPVMVCLKR